MGTAHKFSTADLQHRERLEFWNAGAVAIGVVEHGREAIRKAIEDWRAQIAKKATIPAEANSQPRTRHYVLNHDITVNPDGKTATGRVYWFALTNNTPQTDVQVLYFGHVIEDYVKEDGKWLFSKRAVFSESRHNRALFYPELGRRTRVSRIDRLS